jgi:predicted histone-like DNA-binding protein
MLPKKNITAYPKGENTMSIFFKIHQRRNPLEPTAPPKWYGSVKSIGRYSLYKLATRISRESTISQADVYAVLTSFLGVVPLVLDDGYIVDLGEFGSFRVTISSEGAETEAEYTVANINKRKILFTPGKLLKHAIRNFELQKYPTDSEDPVI